MLRNLLATGLRQWLNSAFTSARLQAGATGCRSFAMMTDDSHFKPGIKPTKVEQEVNHFSAMVITQFGLKFNPYVREKFANTVTRWALSLVARVSYVHCKVVMRMTPQVVLRVVVISRFHVVTYCFVA